MKTLFSKIIVSILSISMLACSLEETVVSLQEPPQTFEKVIPTKQVNVFVDNQTPNVYFEKDSLVLYFGEQALIDHYYTQDHYIDSITINGKVATDYYTIYTGDIHIPIKRPLQDSITNLSLELYDGCPWYSDKGYRILQSISFGDPYVEDWE